MSAETLRRAARLMRERAEAATPGPWEVAEALTAAWHDHEVLGPVTRGNGKVSQTVTAFACGPDHDAAHIASWHPAVALAVADWLHEIASMYPNGHSIGNSHALAVARAYLGDQS